MSQRLLAGLAGIVGSIVELKFTISVGDLWYRCLGNCGQIWPLSVNNTTLILFCLLNFTKEFCLLNVVLCSEALDRTSTVKLCPFVRMILTCTFRRGATHRGT